jgi:hypothetical protein
VKVVENLSASSRKNSLVRVVTRLITSCPFARSNTTKHALAKKSVFVNSRSAVIKSINDRLFTSDLWRRMYEIVNIMSNKIGYVIRIRTNPLPKFFWNFSFAIDTFLIRIWSHPQPENTDPIILSAVIDAKIP